MCSPSAWLLSVVKNSRVQLALFAVVVLALPLLAPFDPTEQAMLNRLSPPTKVNLLGTDQFGRDILSRILYGVRTSAMIAALSVGLGFFVGVSVGTVIAVRGGWIERIVVRWTDAVLSFPDLVTGLLFLAVLGPGTSRIILVLAFLSAPHFLRVAYGSARGISMRDYVAEARLRGASVFSIARMHIWPNIASGLNVFAVLWLATAIRLEANFSFLGLGVAPPTPTLGGIVRDGVGSLTRVPVFPLSASFVIFLIILYLNWIGDKFNSTRSGHASRNLTPRGLS